MKYTLLLLLLSLSFYAQAQGPSFIMKSENTEWYKENAKPCKKGGGIHNGGVLQYKGQFINLFAIKDFKWERGSKDHYIVRSHHEEIEIYIIKEKLDRNLQFYVSVEGHAIYNSNLSTGHCRKYIDDILGEIKGKIRKLES